MALDQDNLVIKGEQCTKASCSKKLRGRRVENLDTSDLIEITQNPASYMSKVDVMKVALEDSMFTNNDYRGASASHMSKVDVMNVAVDGSMIANNDYGGAYAAFLAMNQ